MKKFILAILAVSLLAVPAVAQTSVNPGIKAYAILGKGIAVSTSDPMDFIIVKFGLGRVVTNDGNETVIGVVIADDERYRLREVNIEEGYAEGEIFYGGDNVGSFELTSVMKGDTEIWVGDFRIGGIIYNLYLIEGVRPIRAGELKEKVADYCRENEDANCAGRIEEFCQNNPEDSRCQALFRAYCLKGNMEDTRCREAFRNWCKENPANRLCIPFELQRARRYCEEHSASMLCRAIANEVADICENNPDNEGCVTVKSLLEDNSRLFRKIGAIRTRIISIESQSVNETEEGGD